MASVRAEAKLSVTDSVPSKLVVAEVKRLETSCWRRKEVRPMMKVPSVW